MEDLLGRKNVNFSVELDEGDSRIEKFKEQRMTRGFDDSECWNLDHTIAEFILPRLKVFREQNNGYPARLDKMENWNKILDEMIEGFELCCNEDNWNCSDQNIVNGNQKKIQLALEHFKDHFVDLWW